MNPEDDGQEADPALKFTVTTVGLRAESESRVIAASDPGRGRESAVTRLPVKHGHSHGPPVRP